MADEVTIKVSNDSKHKKKISAKKVNSRTKKENKNIEKILIENFISMQKVMTNMAIKFDHLTKQISELLNLFEDSARAINEKEINLELKSSQDPKEIIERLNKILDQNKLIAKGLTLMHETATNPQTHYSLAPTIPQKEIKKIPEPTPLPASISQMTPSKLNLGQPETPEITTKTKTPGAIEEPEPFGSF
jgi:hypothetical protein